MKLIIAYLSEILIEAMLTVLVFFPRPICNAEIASANVVYVISAPIS